MFKNLRENIKSKLGVESSEESTVEDDAPHDSKEESRLIVLLEKAREVFIQKGLVGNVEITRSFAAFYRTVSCDIDNTTDDESAAEEVFEADTELSTLQKMAVNAIVKCVHGLEKRSLAYRNKTYKANLSLSSTVYVTAPFLGLVSLSVSCTATVASLLNSATQK